MKLFYLICSMLFTFQLFAGDHENGGHTYENWLFDDDDAVHNSLTPESIPKKRKADNEPAPRMAAKKQRAQDGDEDYEFNVTNDDSESDIDENQEFERIDDFDHHDHKQQLQPEPGSPAHELLPSTNTKTTPLLGGKSPRFLELFKGGMTAEQISQCIANKHDKLEQRQDEESIEPHPQDLVCLWAGCVDNTNFATPKALHDHIKGVHTKKLRCDVDGKFYCSFRNCSKSYTVKSNLISHLSTHTGMRFSCHECGQDFKNESTLKVHKNRLHDHREENTFTCTDCGTNIIGKNNFDRHINAVHKDIRPFPCDFEGCSQAFKTKEHLQEHSAIHTKERLSCPHCTSTFSQRPALDSHVKDKHSEDSPLTYKCDICQRDFSNRSNLMRHKKETHAY